MAQAEAVAAVAAVSQSAAAATTSHTSAQTALAGAVAGVTLSWEQYNALLAVGADLEGRLSSQISNTQSAMSAAASARLALNAANEQARAVSADLAASEEQQQVATANLAVALGEAQQAYASARQAMVDTRVVLADVRSELAAGLIPTAELQQGMQQLAVSQSQLTAQSANLNVGLAASRQTMSTLTQATIDQGAEAERYRGRLTSLIAGQLLFNEAAKLTETLMPALTNEVRAAQVGFQAYVATGNLYIAVAAGIVDWVGEETAAFIKLSDAVRLGSLETGLSQNTFQALGVESKALGANVDNVVRSMDFMARNTEAMRNQLAEGKAPTGQFSDALRTLNIDLLQFSQMPADERLRVLIDRFTAFPNKTQAAALALDVFSRGGYQMIPILQAGTAELDHWTTRITDGAAAVEKTQGRVVSFHRANADLSVEMTAVSNVVGGVVVVVFGTLAQILADTFFLVSKLIEPIKLLGDAWQHLPGPIKSMIELMGATFVATVSPAVALTVALAEGVHKLAGVVEEHAEAQKKVTSAYVESSGPVGAQLAQLQAEAQWRQAALAPSAAQADAIKNIDTAVKASNVSAAAGRAFQQQFTEALREGALVGTEYTTMHKALEAQVKASEGAEKQGYETLLKLIDAVHLLGPDVAQVSENESQATLSAKQWAEGNKLVLDSLTRLSDESSALNTKIGNEALAGAGAFSGAYGEATADAARSFQSSANTAVTAYQAAMRQLIADAEAERDATDPLVKAQLKDRLDADRDIAESALKTANARITAESQYLNLVKTSVAESRQLHLTMVEDELHLSHLSTTEKQTDLGKWLQAEIVVTDEILRLETALRNAQGFLSRTFLASEIANAKVRLDAIKENVSVEELRARYIAQDQREENKAAQAAITDIKDQTQALVDLNQIKQAGNELAREGLDLEKQVGTSRALFTQEQVEGLHTLTEAARQQASADLGAAQAAQANWLAVAQTIDTTTGLSTKYSQAQINQARAQYEATQRQLQGTVANFNAAFSAESTAQSALDRQRDAAASAEAAYAKSQVTFARERTDALNQLTTLTVEGQGKIGQATLGQLNSSIAAWNTANDRVLDDQRRLTEQLSDEDRKRLQAQLAVDQAAASEAQQAQQRILRSAQAEVAAENALQSDRRSFYKQALDFRVADVTGANRAEIADYQRAAAAVLAVEQRLAGDLSDEERARLNAVLVVDKAILADRQQTAQLSIDAENKYVQAYFQAQNDLISEQGKVFDLDRQIRHLTATERGLQLQSWLNAEIATHQAIAALEVQLSQTVDEATRGRLLLEIQADRLRLASYEEMARRIIARAQDIDEAAKKAATSVTVTAVAAGRMGQALPALGPALQSNVVNPLEAAKLAAQQASDAVAQLLGIVNSPSTQENQLKVISDQYAIQIAQLEEQGVASTDPRIAALQALQKPIDDQITAYQNERRAEADLAQAQGDLNSGMTNSITVIRSLQGQLTTLESNSKKLNSTTVSFYQTATDVANTWAKGTVTAVGTVIKAYGDLAAAEKLAAAAQPTAGKVSTTGSTGSSVTPAGGAGLMRIPYYANGGRVTASGLAFVHQDEIVMPATTKVAGPPAPVNGSGGGISLTIQVDARGMTEEQAERIATNAGKRIIEEKFGGRASVFAGRRVG